MLFVGVIYIFFPLLLLYIYSCPFLSLLKKLIFLRVTNFSISGNFLKFFKIIQQMIEF